MIRRQFFKASFVGCGSLLGLSACQNTRLLSPSSAIIAEFDQQLTSTPLQWTNTMLQAVRAQTLSPLTASRSFACAHFAGYLAMTGDGLGVLPDAELTNSVNPDLAYGVAFCLVLEEALSLSLLGEKRAFLQSHSNTAGRTESINWAKSQAKRVIRWRTQDGSQEALARLYPKRYPKQHHALSWSPTGPFYGAKQGPGFAIFERGDQPAWGQQKTWVIDDVARFEADPFPDLGSPEFERQFNKVREIGDSANPRRTQEQNEIALFWEDGLMGVTVPGHFQLIAMQLILQKNISPEEQARLLALLSLAQADAGIVAWHNKYHYDVIRPETAIRFAKTRFNSAKLPANKRWKSYIPTPSFPAYVSGHSVFGAASCGVLARFFGSDKINLTSPAPDMVNWPNQLRGVRRRYRSLQQMSEENGLSREFGGVHWESDNTEGSRLGREIANHIQQDHFQKKS